MTAHRTRTARLSAALLAVGFAATIAGCADTSANAPEAPPAPSSSTNGTEPTTDGITMERAATIATDKYGGTATSVEDDSYKGEPAWEVEIDDSTEGRIEVKVSKATGDILDMEHDD